MDAILTNTKAWLSGLAGIVLAGTSVHEWLYHEHHRHASGPSEVLAIGFLAGAVIAFIVMFIAKDLAEHRRDTFAHLTDAERKARVDEYMQKLGSPN